MAISQLVFNGSPVQAKLLPGMPLSWMSPLKLTIPGSQQQMQYSPDFSKHIVTTFADPSQSSNIQAQAQTAGLQPGPVVLTAATVTPS